MPEPGRGATCGAGACGLPGSCRPGRVGRPSVVIPLWFLPFQPIRPKSGAACAADPPTVRSLALKLTTPQLDSIRQHLEAGLRTRSPASDASPRVSAAGLCLLADFPNGALVDSGDLAAGVVRRFGGTVGGTALLALDPEDALAWVQASPGSEAPLERFLGLASAMVEGAISGWANAIGTEVDFGEPGLREDSVVGMLLATHAPSDTLILSARIELSPAGGDRVAHLYLMVEPKVLELWAGRTAEAPDERA